jgi:hypothetical protein
MRFPLLLVSTALAASVTLSACASGGPQAIPGGASVAAIGHHARHLVVVGGDASCGSAFFQCATLYPGTTTIEICFYSRGPSCVTRVGNLYWYGTVVTYPGGERYRKIKASFSPNYGNPTTNIFRVKKIKSTHGKVKWAENVTACELPYSSCFSLSIGLIGG